ncbi:MAG: hypothetical protein IKB35_02265 [Clostridia bacterium]|nr:hypothetical protein [Clostridia bacterium]
MKRPSLAEDKIEPITQIQNAGDVADDAASNIEALFLSISPFSYSLWVRIAPTGFPQMFPIIKTPIKATLFGKA